MDFLDPRKQRSHTIRIMVGYVFIALTLATATAILLFQAAGFGYKNGEVIQNGLVFLSSTPEPATIYLNGQKYKDTTNARLGLPAGQYTVQLSRDGYRPWKRAITVEGGSVTRFDYPFLVPQKLTTTNLRRYDQTSALTTQSLDRRWLLIQSGDNIANFEIADLNNPQSPAKTWALPDNILAKSDGGQGWQLADWASDNRHLLVKHLYNDNAKAEYILIDTQDPDKSVNLSDTLGAGAGTVELRNKAYDQYFTYDPSTLTLYTASLKKPTPDVFLQHVLAYKTHGTSTVLYVTDQTTADGKLSVRLRDGDNTYPIRTVAAGTSYLLDLTQYGGAWYVVAGAESEDRTYVYKDPAATLRSDPSKPLVPVALLKQAGANYLQFSDNARFIMVESGQNFSVYDAENDKSYAYTLQQPIDPPQTHAVWMDGSHMIAVSNGNAFFWDFDNANREVLVPALPGQRLAFNKDFTVLYTFTAPNVKTADGSIEPQFTLTSTPLRTPADQ